MGFDYASRPSDPAYEIMPVGVIGLLNLLRDDGLAVRGLNYPLERYIDLGFGLCSWLRGVERPRLARIDLQWYEHSCGALDLARVLKDVYPNVPVVLGGLTASYYADEILSAFPQVDIIVRGDAEEPLRRLGRVSCAEDSAPARAGLAAIPNIAYRDGNGRVVQNQLSYVASASELNNIDYLDVDFLEHPRHYLGALFVGSDAWYPADGYEYCRQTADGGLALWSDERSGFTDDGRGPGDLEAMATAWGGVFP